MTVSWRRGLARISSGAGGEFDGGYAVDRWDRLSFGWSPGDRFWNPCQGIQLRQYFDTHGCNCGLHRDDHGRPLDGGSGASKNIARQLGPDVANELHAASMSLAPAMSPAPGNQAAEEGGFLFSRDQPPPENAKPAARSSTPEEVVSVVKQRRNLLFSSSSRKERERAQARTADPSAADLRPAPPTAPPAFESGEAPPRRSKTPGRNRNAQGSPMSRRCSGAAAGRHRHLAEANTGPAGTDRYPPAARNEDQPPVTVLKSGVVDGMAYSLYSDGSIEAQMPEGMMRFASIDELRSHLDQRP